MKVQHLEDYTEVILSKRNLLALLHKVDDPTSFKTITHRGLIVRVEPDDVHYGGRTPGPMSKATEKFILEHQQRPVGGGA